MFHEFLLSVRVEDRGRSGEVSDWGGGVRGVRVEEGGGGPARGRRTGTTRSCKGFLDGYDGVRSPFRLGGMRCG